MTTSGMTARRVLVVDDEPLVRDSIRRMLAIDGYVVETVTNAEEALNLFRKERFDLIITDYSLPLMKGDQLAAAIKARDKNQPVALISAFTEAIHFAGIPLDAVDLVITKPIGWREFRHAVAKLLAPRGNPPAATPER